MTRILTVLFFLAFFTQACESSAQSQDTTLDVVSWNLEFFGADYASGPPDKTLQRENAKKIIRFFNADLYGLVEIVDTADLRILRDSLGSNYEYVISPYSTSGAIGTNGWRQAQKLAFLYKKNVFSNVSTRGMMLTSPTASYNWANGRLPFLMKADATVNGITKTFHFILIHGKAGSTNTDYVRRLAGAQELKDTLDANFSTANTMIIGDYNDALHLTISTGSGPGSSFRPIVDDSTDADHYKSVTLPLGVAGQTTMLNFPNVIDNHVISNEVVPFYIINSAKIRTDVTAVVPNYVTAQNTSDHYPVFSQYNLSGNVTPLPTVPAGDHGIKVFPSPTSGKIYFRAAKTLHDVQVRIVDMKGQTIAAFNYDIMPAATNIEPALRHLNSGVYIVQFISAELKTAVRIVKE